MEDLLAIDKSDISRHLKNIFENADLEEEVGIAKIAIPTKHGAMHEKELLKYKAALDSCEESETV